MLIELNREMSAEAVVMRSDVICDKDKIMKSKQSNKFSIENILGLNDDSKVNRLDLIELCEKGKGLKSNLPTPT